MQVEVKIDPKQSETKVLILTPQMTPEVTQLMTTLSQPAAAPIIGVRDEKLMLLTQEEIIRVYALEGKVYATTDQGEFALRQRLYEMEERLDKRHFVRISNSEIINLRRTKCFDLKLTGTICVSLEGGVITYVSRRYVKGVKAALGV